jgi:polar amino acid transport system substrate-binding protein
MKKALFYYSLWLGASVLLPSWVYGTELKFNTETFVPFNYEIDGVVSGPTADVVRRICNEMKFTCSLQLLPWRRTQQEVRDGKAHAMFSIGWNVERSKWLYFSPPVVQTAYGFFVRDNNPLKFNDVADVRGYTVGVYGPSNTSYSLEKIKEQIQNLTIDLRPDTESGFKKLSLGRVDAVYNNRDAGRHLVEKLNLTNIRYAGTHRTLKYYIGFSQKYTDKKIVDQFNATFLDLHKKGAIQEIFAKYNMEAAKLD